MNNKTAKQDRFVEEYLIDLNATQAAIRAGYSEKTARQIGQENLSKPNIQEAIQKAMQKRSGETKITQKMVLEELAIIGFSDLQNYINIGEDTGTIVAKTFEEMPENSSRALRAIREDRAIKEDAKGDQVTVYDKIKFELHDKIKALELIGRHLGMFMDKIEHSGEIQHKLSITELKKSLKQYKENGN